MQQEVTLLNSSLLFTMLYAFEFPLKKFHCDHDGDVTIIPLTKGNV